MKLIKALLSANLTTLFAKISCNAPPDLGKGIWNCENNNSYNHGETCDISGDDCAGTIKCWKGNWKGKTSKFCPKDCVGIPRQPGSGGSFECETEDYRTCELKPWNGFKCSSSVVCNTKKGSWTGKAKCSFETNAEVKNNPPARPNGEWSCTPQRRGTNKCRFTCNDGRKAGSGKVGNLGWVFSIGIYRGGNHIVVSSDWNFCCPDSGYEFGCDNGIVGKSDVCPDESSTSVDVCERCDVGYDLLGTECALKGLSTTTITTPNHFTTVQTSNAPTTAPPTTAFTTTAPTTSAHITTTSTAPASTVASTTTPATTTSSETSNPTKLCVEIRTNWVVTYNNVQKLKITIQKLRFKFQISNEGSQTSPCSSYYCPTYEPINNPLAQNKTKKFIECINLPATHRTGISLQNPSLSNITEVLFSVPEFASVSSFFHLRVFTFLISENQDPETVNENSKWEYGKSDFESDTFVNINGTYPDGDYSKDSDGSFVGNGFWLASNQAFPCSSSDSCSGTTCEETRFNQWRGMYAKGLCFTLNIVYTSPPLSPHLSVPYLVGEPLQLNRICDPVVGNAGYHLVKNENGVLNKCVSNQAELTQNVCNCDRGTPSTGSKCKNDGERRCHSCDYPFSIGCTTGGRSFNETHEHHGSNEHTSHRRKRDSHGSSGGGSWCSTWQDSDNTNCNGCHQGYKWNRKTLTCTAYLCSCPNGTPTVGTGYDRQVCNGNGKPRCDSCDDGFELSEHRDVWTCQPV